jgi:hypothetical protein
MKHQKKKKTKKTKKKTSRGQLRQREAGQRKPPNTKNHSGTSFPEPFWGPAGAELDRMKHQKKKTKRDEEDEDEEAGNNRDNGKQAKRKPPNTKNHSGTSFPEPLLGGLPR